MIWSGELLLLLSEWKCKVVCTHSVSDAVVFFRDDLSINTSPFGSSLHHTVPESALPKLDLKLLLFAVS